MDQPMLMTHLLLSSAPWPPTPATWSYFWNLEPLLLCALFVATFVYASGVTILWRRAGIGRGTTRWQVACYAGGMLTLLAALVSPLDTLSGVLFSAHMAQHLLLLLVAAPLFVLSRPLFTLLWGLPRPLRIGVGRAWRKGALPHAGWALLVLPPVAFVLHFLVLWGWHAPVLYQAALADPAVHALEHASFLAAGGLLWWTIIHPHGGARAYGVSVMILFLTALQGGVLGALLTFSPQPWYPIYMPLTRSWGLSPLADQQLAGVLMWIPSGIVYLLAIATVFVLWLQAIGRSVEAYENRARRAAQP
jgi:putative membrane protein